MTAPVPPYEVRYDVAGQAHVRVAVGIMDRITLVMRPDLVGTPTGDEIIRRAVAAHADRRSIVAEPGA